MARHASIGPMIAAAALVAWPVLAQTTGASPAAQPPGATSSHTTTTTGPPGRDPECLDGKRVEVFTVDHQVRVSKVVGTSVYNDQNQSIGSVDDMLMNDNDHRAATVVLSVGGFLGMGSKLVSVPFDQLKFDNDKIVMPGATKASLEGMPEYHYTNA